MNPLGHMRASFISSLLGWDDREAGKPCGVAARLEGRAPSPPPEHAAVVKASVAAMISDAFDVVVSLTVRIERHRPVCGRVKSWRRSCFVPASMTLAPGRSGMSPLDHYSVGVGAETDHPGANRKYPGDDSRRHTAHARRATDYGCDPCDAGTYIEGVDQLVGPEGVEVGLNAPPAPVPGAAHALKAVRGIGRIDVEVRGRSKNALANQLVRVLHRRLERQQSSGPYTRRRCAGVGPEGQGSIRMTDDESLHLGCCGRRVFTYRSQSGCGCSLRPCRRRRGVCHGQEHACGQEH